VLRFASVLLAALALLAFPAAASALRGLPNVSLDGQTDQGKRMSLIVGHDDRIRAFTIPWSTRSCRRGPSTLAGESKPDEELLVSTSRRFAERLRVVVRDREDPTLVSTIRVDVRGTRARRAGRWTGTISARAVVRRDGRVFDRCRLDPLRWRAAAPAVASLRLEAAPGNYVGEDVPLAFDQASAQANAPQRTPEEFSLRFTNAETSWNVTLTPPVGGRGLRPGRYAGEVLNVSGDGRGCNGPSGEVVIERVRLDRHRHVRELAASFSQECPGDDVPLRGRIVFRRGF
jgi:hypothetical protein